MRKQQQQQIQLHYLISLIFQNPLILLNWFNKSPLNFFSSHGLQIFLPFIEYQKDLIIQKILERIRMGVLQCKREIKKMITTGQICAKLNQKNNLIKQVSQYLELLQNQLEIINKSKKCMSSLNKESRLRMNKKKKSIKIRFSPIRTQEFKIFNIQIKKTNKMKRSRSRK
ncbi:UNKNOWN [Stylonychia lemnae]|uniref:Uncharacterized protein n=1 Tax=Stylonychia lemnae TaxID=5949 RepID=A0A077ZUY1_STYLE|nr:UNKNOWN [Stylonychia lemnae]|eukprot:CDW73705.1 UNKNOWN [Stylonychia lemnae]